MRTLLFTAVFLLPLPFLAAEPKADDANNLISNGGFEEAKEVNLRKFGVFTQGGDGNELLKRGVKLPSDTTALMPVMVFLNPYDGWPGSDCGFQYVQGQPGQDVHSGERAVRIESPSAFSAIAMGDWSHMIPVLDGIGLDDRGIPRGKECRVSLYAKGRGTIRLNPYMYDVKLRPLAGEPYGKARTIVPEQFTVTSEGEWRKFEGTIRVNFDEVKRIWLAISVRGSLSLDDVELYVE